MAETVRVRRGVVIVTAASLFVGFLAGFVSTPANPIAPTSLTQRAPVSSEAIATAVSEPLQEQKPEANVPAAKNDSETGRESAPLPQNSPKHSRDYALAANGGTAAGGQHPELLIDGNHAQYDGANGYAQTEWNATPPQPFTITLKQAEPVNAVRFLLWDQDNRFYRYKLDVCPDLDDAKWKTVADRSGERNECRGWQVLLFQTQSVRRLRLTGTFGSANSGFHVVEFEAYDAPAGLSKPWEDVDF